MPITIDGVERFAGRVHVISGAYDDGKRVAYVIEDDGRSTSHYCMDGSVDVTEEYREKRRVRMALEGEAYQYIQIIDDLFTMRKGSIVRFVAGHKAETDDREWEVLRFNHRGGMTVDVESGSKTILSVALSSLETVPVPTRKTPAKGRCLQCCTMQPLDEFLYHWTWVSKTIPNSSRGCKTCLVSEYCAGGDETTRTVFRGLLNMEASTANRHGCRAAWIDAMLECGAETEKLQQFRQTWGI